ncbi:uncharacterized protein LOC121399137 [Xenopus laevis]|uniref:Gypsy retrotransposon integrase-like protein 1 n=1 Tax=Xenopus laevis TaxID=8355 RepID=A0A8J1LZV4_XENLA|nr:uncharacterized protein LOC121399137 [Xenopus laevis]
MQPLYDALTSDPFTLTPAAEESFHTLKSVLSTAPALGLPDYEKPFKLFVSERQGHALGVLAQSYGQRIRPIGYFSGQLDNVAKGSPSYMRAVYAAQLLLDKTADLILVHDCTLLAPHDITAILNQTQPKHMSAARHLRLQCAILLPDNVTLQRCTILNPSTLLPIPSPGGVEEHTVDTHDCFELMQQETAHLPTVSATALDNPDITLFVDGSRFSDDSGKFHTGYAVTTTDSVLEARPLPASCSAQEAELKALTAACKLAAGKTANIFSDSRYAQGVALDFGTIWKIRGFLTATGSPIKNSQSVADLMDALTLPKQVALLKVKAHGRLTSPEAIGNHLADTTAKEIAVTPLADPPAIAMSAPLLQVTFLDSIDKLKLCQTSAPTDEINGWLSKDATFKDGLYSCNKKPCIPRNLYPSLVQWAHGPTHVSKNLMNNLISKLYFAPGITSLTRNYTAACAICAKCNPGRLEKPPVLHLAKPQYPFQRIQIDHIQMPRCGRFDYVLVIVDMFSGWPEALPVANMTAKTTAKKNYSLRLFADMGFLK